MIWAIIWWLFFRNSPEEHPWISDREKNEIISGRQEIESENTPDLDRRILLKSTNMWSAIVQYFCSNFTFFFALTWLFPHLKEKYGLNTMEAGWFAIAPFIAGAIGNWLAGILVDRIYRNGNWNRSRQLPAIIGFGLAAFGMLASVYMSSAAGAVLMLSIAILGADMTLPPSWSLCVDIGKQHSGAVSGTMNMAGNIGSFITALAFPYLTAWTGSVDYFFYVSAGLNLLAIIFWTRVRVERGLAY